MKKYILLIKLFDSPLVRDRNTKDCKNGDRFDHGAKRLIIVNVGLLTPTISYKYYFVARQRTICIEFFS